MATYFKYAERSAESQVNWAEVGKNMTDMLQEQARIRQDKINALDEAARQFGEELSNAPQGEHVGATEESLRFADDVSQYMLMKQRLWKSGDMSTKDYLIGTQNIMDGTKKALSSVKAFQENYAKLMDRAVTDVSSEIELKRLEKVQGYGNFKDSGFFIDPTTGKVNVALKDMQIIDGKKVITMKEGSSRGMQYIDGAINGRVDKFKYLEPLTELSKTYGEEIRTTIDPSTISKMGTIKSINDLRQREDIDSDTKKILFHYMTSVTDSVNALITNPLQRGSLLIDTMGYKWTDDPAEAAKNPMMVLEVTDPNTGRGELKFTKEQEQASTDFLVQQFLGMQTRKEEARPIGQTSQLREPSAASRAGKENEAAAGAWNQLYTGETAAEKKAAAEILLGTPIAQQAGLLGIDLAENGKIKLTYLNSAKNRTINYIDDENKPISLRDHSALGVELHGVVDRDKAVKAGGGDSGFGRISAEELASVTASRQGPPAAAPAPVKIPDSIFKIKSEQSAQNIKSLLPLGFKVEEDTGFFGASNNVVIIAPNGETFTYNANLTNASQIPVVKEGLQNFIKQNQDVKTGELD